MWIINDWHAIFEKAESRRWNKISWVRMPVGFDGRGYRRLMRHRLAGLEAFGCFALMVEVASTMPTRGALAGSSGPLEAIDLEDITFVDAEAFERAFVLLSSVEIGWISDVDELPANWWDADRIALTTRAASLPRARRLRAAPDEFPTGNPVQNGSHTGLIENTQRETPFAQDGPVQSAIPPVSKPQEGRKEGERVEEGSQLASDTQVHGLIETVENMSPESLARVAEELGEGLLPVTPAPRKRTGAKPSRNDVTRMAQALQTYAQHLTHRAWPLPDWPMALKACSICHPNYTQAEEALRTSALAKRPRGSNNRVEMQTYGLPITILESAFQKRSQ